MDRSARSAVAAPASTRGRAGGRARGPVARKAAVATMTCGAVVLLATGAAAAVPVQVVGHRGGSDFAAENSLDAFRHAISVGADAVEFDVRFTKDAVAIISHDATMDRETNCSGAINTFTLAKLQTCRITVKAGAAAQAIPTLDQTLSVLAPSSVKLYVHVKEGSTAQAKAIVAALNKYKLNTTSGATNRSVVFADSGNASFLTNLKAAGAKRMGTIFNSSKGWSAPYPVIIAYDTPVTKALVSKAQSAAGGSKFVVAVEGHPVTASQVAGLGLNGFMANELDGFLVRLGRLEDPAVTAARLAAEKAAAAKAAADKAAAEQAERARVAALKAAADKAAADKAAATRPGVHNAAQQAAGTPAAGAPPTP